MRKHANHQIDIRCFEEVLLYPTLASSHYKHVESPNESSNDEIRFYKHPTGGKISNVPEDWNPEFAILVLSTAADSARFSKLYFGRSCLDFWIDKAQDSLVLKGIRYVEYTSKLEKYSEKDLAKLLDPEGRPDVWKWHTLSSFNFPSINDEGRHRTVFHRAIGPRTNLTLGLTISLLGLAAEDVMQVLSGWRLLFCEVAPEVVLKVVKKLGGKTKLRGALVMVWKAEAETDKDVQLLIRTSSTSAEPDRGEWLSMSGESSALPSTYIRLRNA